MVTIFQPAAKAAIRKAMQAEGDDRFDTMLAALIPTLRQNNKDGVTFAEFGAHRLNLLIAKVYSVNVPATCPVDEVEIVMLMSQDTIYTTPSSRPLGRRE